MPNSREVFSQQPEQNRYLINKDYESFNNTIESFIRNLLIEIKSQESIQLDSLDYSWFQQHNFLLPLASFFQGDIDKVLHSVWDCHSSLPLIEADGIDIPIVRPSLISPETQDNESLQTWLISRTNEIISATEERKNFKSTQKIQKKLQLVEAGYRFAEKGTRKSAERKKNKRENKIARLQNKAKHTEKAAVDWIEQAYFRDKCKVLHQCIDKGETVALLQSNADPYFPALVLANKDREGKAYIFAQNQNLHEQLTEGLFTLLTDMDYAKGIIYTDTKMRSRNKWSQQTGRSFVPQWFQKATNNFFDSRMRDEKWYFDQYSFKNSNISEDLALFWNFVPLQVSPVEGLLRLEPQSLDVVVINDLIGVIPDQDISPLLWATDRTLKVGGKLVLYESPSALTAAEYYNFELFFQKYQKQNFDKLAFPDNWRILIKESDFFDVHASIQLPWETPRNMSQKSSKESIVSPARYPELDDRVLEKSIDNQVDRPLNLNETDIQQLRSYKTQWTIKDIAQRAKVPEAVIKKRLVELNIKDSTPLPARMRGRRGVIQYFTPEEVQIIINNLSNS